MAIAASLSVSAKVSAIIGSKFPGDGFFADLVETLTVRKEVSGAVTLGQGVSLRKHKSGECTDDMTQDRTPD